MTDKAYIVANEDQEREVLEKLERRGAEWFDGGEKPTEWIPSQKGTKGAEFPYVLLDDGEISWKFLNDLSDEEIVFDGRKEEQMSEKYVVSQKFMNELEEWKDNRVVVNFVNGADISHLPLTVNDWWFSNLPAKEYNNRLIAIIRWVNGEDVFEVDKPKKWVVRSKDSDLSGDYWYVYVYKNLASTRFNEDQAAHFNTKEEAESWANSHQEVIEVEE